MVKYNYFYFIFFCLLGTTTYAQKVSNITFQQEQSNIVVSYDLETKTPCKISLYVSTNGGASWQGPLKKVTENVVSKMASGRHSITWNVLDELDELSGSNIKFQVRAEELKKQTIASITKALIKNPKDAKLFKLRGDLKKESDDTKGAIADYTKAILLNPKDAPTFYKRGKVKYENEDYNGAISDFIKALELEPKNTIFLYAKAIVKRRLNDKIGAIKDSNKVIELDSTFEYIYYFRGINKYELDDIEGAKYDFEKHIKNSNNPINEYNRIANWRWNNDDYKTAIDYFTKAIDLILEVKTYNNVEVDLTADINNVVAADTTESVYKNYLGRAFSKYKLKDFTGANVDFDNYIKKSELEPIEAYREIATGYPYSFEEMNDYENAEKYLTIAIDLDPKNEYIGSYYISRAEIKHKLKNYSGAVDDYSKAIELNPQGYYYKSRGDSKVELKDYSGAIEDYSKLIELGWGAFSYILRASAKDEINDFSGAIEDYSKAILLEPKTDYYYYYRGLAKSNLKDYRGAIEDYSKAILLAPNSVDYYINRGNAKYNIGDYKGAISDYTKVILLDPKNGGAYLNRGDAKFLLKDKVGACKDFSKAGELGEDEAYKSINEKCN